MAKKDKLSLMECFREQLSKGTARTQEELKLSLQNQGFEVNQSKISRMLRKLGAIKTVGSEGQIVYQLPSEPEPPIKGSPIENLILDISHNEIMIVVHVSPGSASLIARVIDHHMEKLHILGTVAGDDTIFIVPKSIKTLDKSIKGIKGLLFK